MCTSRCRWVQGFQVCPRVSKDSRCIQRFQMWIIWSCSSKGCRCDQAGPKSSRYDKVCSRVPGVSMVLDVSMGSTYDQACPRVPGMISCVQRFLAWPGVSKDSRCDQVCQRVLGGSKGPTYDQVWPRGVGINRCVQAFQARQGVFMGSWYDQVCPRVPGLTRYSQGFYVCPRVPGVSKGPTYN